MKSTPCLLVLSALVWAQGCVVAQSATQPASASTVVKGQTVAPGRHVEEIGSGGKQRHFIMHVPKAYDGVKPIPVVIVLHGWTLSGELAETYTQMADEGEAKGFVTIFPDGLGGKHIQGWNAGILNLSGDPKVDDVQLITDILDRVERELKVDLDREYVCGHSNGAMLALYAGSRLPNRLAAVGSVAGTVGLAGKTLPFPDAPISVILIHGKKDPLVAYAKGGPALFKGGMSAEESAIWWAHQDGCSPSPAVMTSSNGNVTTELFSGGKGDTEVELVSIANGNHSWPGGYYQDRDNNPAREATTGVGAADLLWEFFRTHPKHAH